MSDTLASWVASQDPGSSGKAGLGDPVVAFDGLHYWVGRLLARDDSHVPYLVERPGRGGVVMPPVSGGRAVWSGWVGQKKAHWSYQAYPLTPAELARLELDQQDDGL